MLDPAVPLLSHRSSSSTGAAPPSRWRRPQSLLLALALASAVFVAAASLSGSARTPSAVSTGSPHQQQQQQLDRPSPLAQDHDARDLLQRCEEKFITQELDHFRANGGGGTFEQRYFVCSRETFDPKTGAIFFYFGAEADVLLYLNNTGIMWENAQAFNALLVFAEHRYFGESIPFGVDDVLSHMEFLSSSQALADYAVLIEALQDELSAATGATSPLPLVGFGGSYGGMLAAWFRVKYPHLIDGAVAASAPVLAFLGDKQHPVDWEGFMRVVTHDMSEAAGSAPNCTRNARRAYDTFVAMGESASGRQELARIFRLCDQEMLRTSDDAQAVALGALSAFASLAMGNYPYASSYMTMGHGFLPAYPVRAACEFLAPEFAAAEDGDEDYTSLLTAFRESAGVLLNSSRREQCFFPAVQPTPAALLPYFFDYIACSELYMPMGSDGVHDVFPATGYDPMQDDARCVAQWGVHLRETWATTEYGGVAALRRASNIVFSNGNLDPWSATGVLASLSASVVSLPVQGGAHHVDLFFSNAQDTPAIAQARETETRYIQQWIGEFYAQAQQ